MLFVFNAFYDSLKTPLEVGLRPFVRSFTAPHTSEKCPHSTLLGSFVQPMCTRLKKQPVFPLPIAGWYVSLPSINCFKRWCPPVA